MQFQLQCLMLMHPKKYLLVLWKILNSTAVDLIGDEKQKPPFDFKWFSKKNT